MKLCEIGLQNIEEIKRLIVGIFSRDPWNDRWTDEQLHLYVLELMGGASSLSLGLYEGDRLIGISLGRVKHWCAGTEYWIEEFGLVPERQGKGLGSEFLKDIERFIGEKGMTAMVLLTERTMPAYQFYKKNGFAEKEEQVFLAKEIG